MLRTTEVIDTLPGAGHIKNALHCFVIPENLGLPAQASGVFYCNRSSLTF